MKPKTYILNWDSRFNVLVFLVPFCVVCVFVLAGMLSTMQRSSLYLPSYVHDSFHSASTELFIRVMGFENAYFVQDKPNIKNVSLSSAGLELATNIRMGDIRTLIGNELPGFLLYKYDILTAGQGTDYTNTPVESSPPLEILLKERGMAKEQLEQYESNTDAPPTANPPKEKNFYIYHTHSWESYFPLLGITNEPDADKAADSKTNITLVGQMLAQELEKNQVGAVVDKTNIGQELKKKGWGTSKAYQASRTIVQSAMSRDKNLKFFLDLHRDSLRKKNTTININGTSYARVVFVLGKENPNFEQNLEFAKSLHEALKVKYPGLSRGVLGKVGKGVNGVYNQDLAAHSILIEVGGVDNDMEELKNTIKALATVITEYYREAEKVNAPN
ncbi:stage II sporulation protein P [Bacillus songklensis]|uniref:Stage II sporulation protein P n=1 Tax=Bacillus songklensis TaxID=1069116 RepID=A0ABV8BA20_9BACI